jgi:hypothetical protein
MPSTCLKSMHQIFQVPNTIVESIDFLSALAQMYDRISCSFSRVVVPTNLQFRPYVDQLPFDVILSKISLPKSSDILSHSPFLFYKFFPIRKTSLLPDASVSSTWAKSPLVAKVPILYHFQPELRHTYNISSQSESKSVGVIQWSSPILCFPLEAQVPLSSSLLQLKSRLKPFLAPNFDHNHTTVIGDSTKPVDTLRYRIPQITNFTKRRSREHPLCRLSVSRHLPLILAQ